MRGEKRRAAELVFWSRGKKQQTRSVGRFVGGEEEKRKRAKAQVGGWIGFQGQHNGGRNGAGACMLWSRGRGRDAAPRCANRADLRRRLAGSVQTEVKTSLRCITAQQTSCCCIYQFPATKPCAVGEDLGERAWRSVQGKRVCQLGERMARWERGINLVGEVSREKSRVVLFAIPTRHIKK